MSCARVAAGGKRTLNLYYRGVGNSRGRSDNRKQCVIIVRKLKRKCVYLVRGKYHRRLVPCRSALVIRLVHIVEQMPAASRAGPDKAGIDAVLPPYALVNIYAEKHIRIDESSVGIQGVDIYRPEVDIALGAGKTGV